MAVVPGLVRRLHGHHGVERAEAVRPRRVAEVAGLERRAGRELAEMLGGDRVHRCREIECDVLLHVAARQDLASELTGARAELEDSQRGTPKQAAERGEEARPERTLRARVLDPFSRCVGVVKVDPARDVAHRVTLQSATPATEVGDEIERANQRGAALGT